MQKVLFIINPISGTNTKENIITEIKNVFEKANILYKIALTEYKGHATIIAEEHINTFDTIVAVGGDGTVNEVSKALVGSTCTFGIIPAGSGNGLARALKIPMSYKKAIEIILRCNTKKIDTCSINNNYFVNVAGIGFDARIADIFSTQKKRGFFTYVKLVFEELLNIKESEITFVFDNKTITKKIVQANFANSNQFGNNAFISPDAELSDQLLDIVILTKFPWYSSISLAIKLFKGSIYTSRYISHYRTNEVMIPDLHGLKAQIDGEAINLNEPLIVKINPLSLNVIN